MTEPPHSIAHNQYAGGQSTANETTREIQEKTDKPHYTAAVTGPAIACKHAYAIAVAVAVAVAVYSILPIIRHSST